MRYNLKLAEAFHKTDIGLDGILVALGKEPPVPPIPDHPETIIWYKSGEISSFEIEGELTYSIENLLNSKKVEIGNMVTSIGDYAFFNCEKLEYITIPNTVISIGIGAFSSCINLESINIPNNLSILNDYLFSDCYELSSIKISNNVTSIGEGTFAGCSSLSSIIIPSSVTSIGAEAFNGCLVLSSITILNRTSPTLQSQTFGYSDNTYTGYNTHNTGDNILKIYQDSTGYDSGEWLDPLQNASKCGFHIEYI